MELEKLLPFLNDFVHAPEYYCIKVAQDINRWGPEEHKEKIFLFPTKELRLGDDVNFLPASKYYAPVGQLCVSNFPLNKSIQYGGRGFKTTATLKQQYFFKIIKEDANNQKDALDGVYRKTEIEEYKISSLRSFLNKGQVNQEEIKKLITRNIENKLNKDKFSLLGRFSLDSIQDEVMRSDPKISIILDGLPGSGKTTTAIKLLTKQCFYTNEGDWLNTNKTWLYVVPNEILADYIQEAFNKEGIPTPKNNITNWEEIRKDILVNHIRLITPENPYLTEYSSINSSQILEETRKLISIFNISAWEQEIKDSIRIHSEIMASMNGFITKYQSAWEQISPSLKVLIGSDSPSELLTKAYNDNKGNIIKNFMIPNLQENFWKNLSKRLEVKTIYEVLENINFKDLMDKIFNSLTNEEKEKIIAQRNNFIQYWNFYATDAEKILPDELSKIWIRTYVFNNIFCRTLQEYYNANEEKLKEKNLEALKELFNKFKKTVEHFSLESFIIAGNRYLQNENIYDIFDLDTLTEKPIFFTPISNDIFSLERRNNIKLNEYKKQQNEYLRNNRDEIFKNFRNQKITEEIINTSIRIIDEDIPNIYNKRVNIPSYLEEFAQYLAIQEAPYQQDIISLLILVILEKKWLSSIPRFINFIKKPFDNLLIRVKQYLNETYTVDKIPSHILDSVTYILVKEIAFLENLHSIKNIPSLPDYYKIIVDEATDFNPIQIKTLKYLTPNGLLLCGDLMQRTTKEGLSDWKEIEDIYPKYRNLEIGYRQSPNLLKIANKLYNDVTGKPREFKSCFPEGLDYPVPVYTGDIDFEQQIDYIKKVVGKIYDKKPSLAVFVKDKDERKKYADRLQEIRSYMTIRECDNGQTGKDNELRIVTYNYIKGLEFEETFLTGLNNLDEDLQDKILYLALTRATKNLHLIGSLPKRLQRYKDLFKYSF